MIEWQTYWAHKGHVYGECMSKSNWDYIYVHIPKNSSSWAGALLAHWCLCNRLNCFEDKDLLSKTPVIILRDPLKRWISGIAEYARLYHPRLNIDDINNTMLEWVFDRVAFDDHTERQTMFLQNINLDNAVWFYADENLSLNFTSWLRSIDQIDDTFVMPDLENTTDQSLLKQRVSKFFKEKLTNTIWKSKILNYYKSDYELINNVKFYQTS